MSRLVRGGFITNGKQATVVPSRAKISSSPKQKSKTKQTKKRSVRSSSGSPEARPIYPADVAKWKLNKKWHKVMLNCIKDAQESQVWSSLIASPRFSRAVMPRPSSND